MLCIFLFNVGKEKWRYVEEREWFLKLIVFEINSFLYNGDFWYWDWCEVKMRFVLMVFMIVLNINIFKYSDDVRRVWYNGI